MLQMWELIWSQPSTYNHAQQKTKFAPNLPKRTSCKNMKIKKRQLYAGTKQKPTEQEEQEEATDEDENDP